MPDWKHYPAAIWRPRTERLRGVRDVDPVHPDQLLGIETQKARLLENTRRFVDGRGCNNALLWGSRGTGKSALVKSMLNVFSGQGLRMIQVDRDDLLDLPEIVDEIRGDSHRFVVFCDDLTFARGEPGYRALKTVLDGSIERPAANVAVYATSNRRHLMPEPADDNRASRLVEGEIHHGDAVEERLSLSDRFGLWLSFYPLKMDGYLAIVDSLFPDYPDRLALHDEARAFARTRGGHSGRTARQFFNHFRDRAGSTD